MVHRKIFNVTLYSFAFIGLFLTTGYTAVHFGLTNTEGVVDNQQEAFISAARDTAWSSTPEWSVIREAVRKDTDVINRASAASGIPARVIVANLTTEQLRLFFTEREYYKQFFEPLKILGSQTQFSWGVMGIKEDTAMQIENNLNATTSPYYLGTNYEHLLDFTTSDIKKERFTRMTDAHDHYYSYLYAGLFLKQITTQWKNAGFNISQNPAVLATLYNIGFKGSKPNPAPQSGGAEIQIGDQIYSFGSLAREFYYSDELINEFPR